MKTGTVKYFYAGKGYGFIKHDESGKEIYVHISGVIDHPLNAGDRVTFDLVPDRSGPRAVNVKKF